MGGATLIGGGIAANSAKKAQQGANDTNAQIAADTNAANWRNYLYSRGVDEDGNPVNTSLPVWSTSGGQPTEQALLNQLLGRSGLVSQADDPGYYASVNQTRKFLAANPDTLAGINNMLAESGDTRSAEQWLHDHVTLTETDQGGGNFTDMLKAYAQTTVPAVEKPTVPAEYQALQNAAIYTANQIYGTGQDWNKYLTDNPDVASAYNGLYKDEQGRSLVPTVGGQVVAMTPQEFAQYHYNTWGSTEGRATRQDSLLNQELDALAPVLDARTALAAQEQVRNDELRARYGDIFSAETQGLADLLSARQAASGNIYDAEKTGLADLLSRRNEASGNIYSAETSGLDRLLNTRKASIADLYGAEMAQADTFDQATQQALARVLNEQTANRARQGFVGASSGDALLRARTLADGLQQSAGARAQVGVNQSSRLGQATEQDALSRLTSDVNQQTRLGSASEQDALALLSAAVNNQTRLGSASEQNALSQLSAGVNNATRLSQVLDADARKAESQAALENALARLTATSNDINRRMSSTGLAGQLYGQQVGLQNTATNQAYADIDALLSRLGAFKTNTQATPTAQSYTVQPTIGSGQVAGAAIANLGQMAGSYFTNQQLINAMNRPPSTTSGTNINWTTPTGSFTTPSVTQNYTGSGIFGGMA